MKDSGYSALKNVPGKPKASLQTASATPLAVKMTINLLPPEVMLQRKQGFKLTLANQISIAALVILIFFTSATLALRFFQNSELKAAKEELTSAEGKVNSLQSREVQIVLLKQRLASIENLTGSDLKRKAIFNLVIYLTPPNIQIIDVSVDKNGNMSLSLASSSLPSIETLFASLGDNEKNSDLISKVGLEGFSLSKDMAYRFNLSIKPK